MRMITQGKHEIIPVATDFRCKVCGQVFKHIRESMTFCAGKGYYAKPGQVPKHLKTTTQWAKSGRLPKAGAVAGAWVLLFEPGRGYFWADLWHAEQVERKQPTKRREKAVP